MSSNQSIELYENLKRLPKAQFDEMCFYLEKIYGYDLAFVTLDGVPIAQSAQELINFVEQNEQGLNYLEEVLEKVKVCQCSDVGCLPVACQNHSVKKQSAWDNLFGKTSKTVKEYNENIPYEPTFDSLLVNKSPDLFIQLQKIRKKVIPDLRKIPNDVYSQDSENHAREVLSLVYTLYSPALKSSFFNENELFVLGVLCLVHDVGMMPRKNCFDNKKLYKNHHKYSFDYVMSMINNKLLDNDIGEIIAKLCLIHGKRIGVARSTLKHLESPDTHVVLIYAMFKVADMLEVEQQPGAILRTIALDVITNNIGEFDIDSESQILTFYPTPEAEPKYFDMLVQTFSDYFQEATQEFNLINLNYQVVTKKY